VGRKALRAAIAQVRERYPFAIDAFVLLPEHFHCLLTLPPEDHDFSVRLRLIKTYVTKRYGQALQINRPVSRSRQQRGESNLWQRRFWEHLIRDIAILGRVQHLLELKLYHKQANCTHKRELLSAGFCFAL
jgi:putative transposase